METYRALDSHTFAFDGLAGIFSSEYVATKEITFKILNIIKRIVLSGTQLTYSKEIRLRFR